jgi:tetratricopeptide (TPR) repeat protein
VLAEEGPRGMRYRLLETLREYGQERLVEAGEAGIVSARHARFFLELVEQAEPELMRSRQAEWLERLDEEYDNVRAALAWSLEAAVPPLIPEEIGLRLVGTLFWYWWMRSYHTEGWDWAAGVLSRTGGAPGVPPLPERAGPPARTWARAKACRSAGGMLWAQGRSAEARPLMEEAVAISREMGGPALLALSLRFQGWAALDSGDLSRGRSAVEESLALFRTIGDQSQIGRSLNFLAALARLQGDDETAAARWEETVTVSGLAGDGWAVSVARAGLAKLAERRGDAEAARSHFTQSLHLRWANKDLRGIADCLEGIAALAREEPEMERAARLFGAAAAANEVVSAPLPAGHWPVERDAAVAFVRSRLGPAAFAAAWAQGHTMPLAEAVAEAFREGSG